MSTEKELNDLFELAKLISTFYEKPNYWDRLPVKHQNYVTAHWQIEITNLLADEWVRCKLKPNAKKQVILLDNNAFTHVPKPVTIFGIIWWFFYKKRLNDISFSYASILSHVIAADAAAIDFLIEQKILTNKNISVFKPAHVLTMHLLPKTVKDRKRALRKHLRKSKAKIGYGPMQKFITLIKRK